MEFSEKLSALLSLSAVKNAELADALGVGRPYISRMKTGERKMPSNTAFIRNMANFFATHCTGDYRRNALYELITDTRLQSYLTEEVLADVIFEWLLGNTRNTSNPAGRFLSSFNRFSPNVQENIQDVTDITALGNDILVYYHNDGIRQAFRDFMQYIKKLDKPCTLRVFSDETVKWLIESQEFNRYWNASMNQLIGRGFSFERITPPVANVEEALRSVERWMPMYTAGVVQQYSYPWTRDGLHRRSMLIIDGHIALTSNSLAGMDDVPVTMISVNPDIVSARNREFDAIRNRCISVMRVYGTDKTDALLDCLVRTAGEDTTGIYKSNVLSAVTLPVEIIERLKSCGGSRAVKACSALKKRITLREKLLATNMITDIVCLSPEEDILAGKVVIPESRIIKSGGFTYTPKEYRMHLEKTLWYLEKFPKYQVILMEDQLFSNVSMYIKCGHKALLIKDSEPFTLFDISDSGLTAAFADYFRRVADEKIYVGSRFATASRLRSEINKLYRLIK